MRMASSCAATARGLSCGCSQALPTRCAHAVLLACTPSSLCGLARMGAEEACGAPCCASGKNYLVLDGDVIFFKFNVTAGGKK